MTHQPEGGRRELRLNSAKWPRIGTLGIQYHLEMEIDDAARLAVSRTLCTEL